MAPPESGISSLTAARTLGSQRRATSTSAFRRGAEFRGYLTIEEAEQYVAGLASHAETLPDPPAVTPIARDPDDDYLITLAQAAAADAIVSGDLDLLVLERVTPPIVSPSSLALELSREST